MINRRRILLWLNSLIVCALFLTSVGCESEKEEPIVPVKEGDVPNNMVSLRSEITYGNEGEWEWIWVCQEENYDANWIRFGVTHYGGLDMKALTAGQIFNNSKKKILEELKRVYTGPKTDREYFEILQKIEEDDIAGYIIWYPNQGEKDMDGNYWGTYRGSYVCFRGPKCVASATTHIMRIESLARGLYEFRKEYDTYAYDVHLNIIANLMGKIQILDNE